MNLNPRKYIAELLGRNDASFIVAAPRSGTTWLMNLLNAHPHIFCTERRMFGFHTDLIHDSGSKVPRLRVTLDEYIKSIGLHNQLSAYEDYDKVITTEFIKAIRKSELKISKKPIVVDKITPFPGTSNIVLEAIDRYFPDSKIIFLLRDGRDVVTSGVFHWFNKKQEGREEDDFLQERRKNYKSLSWLKDHRFFSNPEMKEWSGLWHEVLCILEPLQTKHKVLIIRYEAMIDEQRKVLKKIFEFLSSKSDPEIIDSCINSSTFEKMSGGRHQGDEVADHHVRKGIIGDWKHYFTTKDAQIFNEITGDALVRYNYEAGPDWALKLADRS